MSLTKKIQSAQQHLSKRNIDGWLLYDFHGINDLALRFLEIPKGMLVSRRFFYWIPKKGKPIKILHVIEQYVIRDWPGEVRLYHSWKTLDAELKKLLRGVHTCAMEYSPYNDIPYVSKVDGGTLEQVAKMGPKIVSSKDFLPYFTAVLSKRAIQTHFTAAKMVDRTVNEAHSWIGQNLKKGKKITEYDVQRWILERFDEKDFDPGTPPICAVNEHSADPHFEPKRKTSSVIRKGDFILIDLWCKKKGANTVYADITRVAVAKEKPSSEETKIFQCVKRARQKATDLVVSRIQKNKPVCGYEVDDAARNVIKRAGYERYFVHRTGHSIEYELHGSGVHMDNLEMHDDREIVPGTCFSIEPGIYLPKKFGVRLEYDILFDLDRNVYVTGGSQNEIKCLF